MAVKKLDKADMLRKIDADLMPYFEEYLDSVEAVKIKELIAADANGLMKIQGALQLINKFRIDIRDRYNAVKDK